MLDWKKTYLFFIVILSVTQIYCKTILGNVFEADTNEPIKEAIIMILNSDEELLFTSISNKNGFFYISDVNIDPFNIKVYRYGYKTLKSGPFSFDDNSVFKFEVELEFSPISTQPIEIQGIRKYPVLELMGFYDRRDMEIGYSIYEDEIKNADPVNLISLIRKIPSLRVDNDPTYISMRESQLVLYSSRSFLMNENNKQPLVVYIDDRKVIVHDEISMLKPHEIVAVEYFSSSNTAPGNYVAPFQNTGVLLIWTKHFANN